MEGVSWDHANQRMAILRRWQIPDPDMDWRAIDVQGADDARRALGVGDHLGKLRQLVAPDCYNVPCMSDAQVVDQVAVMLARGDLTLFQLAAPQRFAAAVARDAASGALYQGIIDKALTTLTGDEVEFHHLPADFGLELVKHGCDLKKRLPPGTGDKKGWLRQKVGPLFKHEKVGAVPGGPKVYALVVYKGGHFIARTAVHKHTVKEGKKIPGNFPDSLEVFWVRPDWEKRLADAQKKKKQK